MVVLVKNAPQVSDFARTKVRSYFSNKPYLSNISSSKFIIKPVKYSFEELFAWRRDIRKEVFNIKGVTSLDLDELENRISIGVVNEEYISKVEDFISNLNLPLEAVTYEITGEIIIDVSTKNINPKATSDRGLLLNNTLQDEIRPLTGGTELKVDRVAGVNLPCTFGFNAIWNNKEVFLTNSHCSDNPWNHYTGTKYYQDEGSTELLGTVKYDINGFDCGGLFSNPECRYSDAAIIEYADSPNWDFGTIAKTNGMGINWQAGSIDIIGSFRIVDDDMTVLVNTPLNKMGKESGWTHGFVEGTCVDYAWNSKLNGKILCQIATEGMYSESGDSGSPVFYDNTMPSGDVVLVGINWGHLTSSELAVASPIEGIKEDLGSFLAKDQPIVVTGSGPSFITESGSQFWNSQVSYNDGPVSYQWSIKWEGTSSWSNLGTNSSQSVNINNEDDFQLRVTATDNSDSASFIFSVIVEFECNPLEEICQN